MAEVNVAPRIFQEDGSFPIKTLLLANFVINPGENKGTNPSIQGGI